MVADVSFFDHFATLDSARWDTVGSATSVVDSYLDANGAASGAKCVRYHSELSTSQSWIFAVCLRIVDATNAQPVVNIWSDAGGAAAGTTAALASQRRLRVELQPDGLRYSYIDRNGDPSWWNGTAWVGTEPLNPPQFARVGNSADWYTVVIEYDQPNGRFRFLGVNQEQTAYAAAAQGYRVITSTSWIDLATDAASWGDLWFTIGQRYTDGAAFDFHVEWVKYLTGARTPCVSNNRVAYPDEYKLVVESGIDGLTLVTEHNEISLALALWENGTQGRRAHPALLDGANSRVAWESFVDSDADTEIGVMTATDPYGAHTFGTGNPQIQPADIGTNYSELRVMTWERDLADGKYYLYLGAEYTGGATVEYRIFLFSADTWDGAYTKVSGSGTDGALLEKIAPGAGNPQFGVDGLSDPAVIFEPVAHLWHMFPAGNRIRPSGFPWTWAEDDRAGWAVLHFTSIDRVTWVAQNGGLPLTELMGDRQRLRNVTGGTESTSRFTVDDTAAAQHAADWPIHIRNNGTGEDLVTTRIRKVVDSTTIEVYHWVEGTAKDFQCNRIDGGSITCSSVRAIAGGFELFATVFQPYINSTGSIGDFEGTMRFTAATLDGPWSPDLDSGLIAVHTVAGSRQSKENLSVYAEVIDSALRSTTFTVGAVLTTPTLISNATLDTTSFSVATNLGVPALTPGPATLGTTAFVVGAVLSTPTLSSGSAVLGTTTLTVGAVLGTPSLVAGDVSLPSTTMVVGIALSTPTLAPGSAILGTTTLTVGTTLGTPVLTPGPVTFPSSTLSVAVSLRTPALSPGPAILTPSSFSVGAVLTTPTLSGVGDLSTTTLVVGMALSTPALAPGGVELSTTTFAVGATLTTPTLSSGVVLESTTFVVGATLGTPVLTPGPVTMVANGFIVGVQLTTPTLSSATPGLLNSTTYSVGLRLVTPQLVTPRRIAPMIKNAFVRSLVYLGEDVVYLQGGTGGTALDIKIEIKRANPQEVRDGLVMSGILEFWVSNTAEDGLTDAKIGDVIQCSPRIGGSIRNVHVTEVYDDSDEGVWHLGGRL